MSDRTGRIDLHIHTAVSDGTDTPQALLEAVRAAGFAVFSVTDHDTLAAGPAILRLRRQDDPLFIPGVEFSCRDEQGKCHVLGYGFDPDAPALGDVVSYGQSLRAEKVRARLEKLREEFGFTFSEEEIAELLSHKNPGKPHIGRLMVRHGYADSIGEAISRYIDRVHYSGKNVLPQEAIEGILAGGGIPVLAHPLFGGGSERLSDEEMEQRLSRLTGYGLQGVEAYYSGFSAQQRAQMLALAEKYDLYVTAGSDYHGANKTVALGETGLDDACGYPDRLNRFLDAVQA
jgi:hypothetical protein